MTKLQIVVLLVLGLLLSPISSRTHVLSSGEELVYKVSVLGVDIGRVVIKTDKKTKFNGKDALKVSAKMDSNPGIPFADLHATFESMVDPSAKYSHQFLANSKEGNESWSFTKYDFDYVTGKHIMTKHIDSKLVDSKTFDSNKKWNDGCSIFFFARQFVKSGKNIKVPTVVFGEPSHTSFYFSNKKEFTEIAASSYPIKTVYFHGSATWTGVYGITGKFEGWFSDDAASVPIKAKMKLLVGSADVELISWKRAGNWQPPKAA